MGKVGIKTEPEETGSESVQWIN